MKKHLIAAAVAAAVAVPAAAQVTVYGIMDLGYSQVDNEVTADGATVETKQKNTGNGDGMLSTSRLGFRGTEDLGGGLKAAFRLEYDLVDAGAGGNALGARYSFVELSGGFGTVRLGRQEESNHAIVAGFSAGGGNNMPGALYSGGSGAALSANDAGVRPHQVFVNRAITYVAPTMSGFTVELQTADSSTKDGTVDNNTQAEMIGGSLKYAAGPLSLGIAINDYDNLAAGGADTERDNLALAASYNFGMLQAFLLHTTREDKNGLTGAKTVDQAATEVGVRVPLSSNVQAWASTFSGGEDVAANANDSSGYQLGIKQDLSKRTTIYAIWGSQELEGRDGNAGNNTETDGFGFGIRHSF